MDKKLLSHLTKIAEAHLQLSKSHRAMSSSHAELGKASAADYHRDLKDAHDAAAEAHANIAEACIACCKDIPSVTGSVETNVPSFGSDTFHAALGSPEMGKLQAVPRTGAAPIAAPEADLAPLEEIFGGV